MPDKPNGRYAEIKARNEQTHPARARTQAEVDRAGLIDLVTRLSECLRELAGSPAEFDNPGVGYVVMQVDRGELGNARALLEETKL